MTPDPPPAARGLVRRIPVGVRLGALAVTVVALFVVVALSGSLSADRVRAWVDGFGTLGPVAFVATAALLGCIFFPGPLLAGAAGLLFGTALGTPLALCSATLTAVIAFSIARWLAGDAIERVGGRRIDALVAALERRGFLSVLYLRLMPAMPYNLINYAVGLTRIRLLPFAGATIIGSAPRTWAYVALGGSFGNFGRPETIVAIALIVAMAIAGLVAARLRLPGLGTGSSSPAGRSAGPP